MKKIVFTGGGTGGHIYPNLALMELLKDKYKLAYIGSKDSMEEKIVSKNYDFKSITTVKLRRSLSLKNLLIPFKLIKGISEAKKLLKKEKPDLVFSKGGYVSVPVIIAAHKLNIPCITHESDLSLGLANKINSKSCGYVCTSFDITAKNCKNGVFTGSPIRKSILNIQNLQSNYKNNNKPNLLIVGGSLGSTTINNVITQNLDELLKIFNIYHIVGKGNLRSIKKDNYHELEYSSEIDKLYSNADLIITRGGSNALFEIIAIKKPMLIIPLSKKASRGDQILNAEYFYNKKIANMLLEEKINNKTLIDKILETLNNKEIYINNMKKFNACGNDKIIKLIEKTIKENK